MNNQSNKRTKRTRRNNKKNKNLATRVKDQILQSLKSKLELKFWDQYIAFSDVLYGAVTAGGYIFNMGLSGMAQGVNVSNRIGQQIELKRLQIKGEIGMQSGLTVDAFNKVRLIAFYWKPGDTSIPLVSDILYNAIVGGAEVNSQYNLGRKDTYQIIWDQSFMVSSAGQMGKSLSKTLVLKKSLRYVTSGNILNSDTLYILAISDSNVSPHPIVDLCFRVLYTDD